MNISFICHDLWYDNQANAIIRSIPYLSNYNYKINVILAASSGNLNTQVWPDVLEEVEKKRREKLDETIKSIIKSNPDLIICHHRCITPNLLNSNFPIIIIENTDAPALELSRHLIHLENIIGVIKGTVFSNNDFYNGPFCEGMFHGTFLNKINLPIIYPKRKLSQEAISKIELGYSFGCFPQNKRLLDFDINTKRIFPISFVGTTNYPRSRLISQHRKSAMVLAKKIGVGISGVSLNEYDKILKSSYICLSPLGYGACFRSFEAMYAGNVVIQPDSSYMKSWPNIYESGKQYVVCKYDFSDVESIKNLIIDNWDNWQKQRYENKKLLLDTYWNEESLGNHLKNILDRCCERIK